MTTFVRIDNSVPVQESKFDPELCPRCRRKLPRTEQFWHKKSSNRRDGLNYVCRECMSLDAKARWENDRNSETKLTKLYKDIIGEVTCNVCGKKTGGKVPLCYEHAIGPRHLATDDACSSCRFLLICRQRVVKMKLNPICFHASVLEKITEYGKLSKLVYRYYREI